MPARKRALTTDDDANVDGCDVEFNPIDSTPDTELPKATGGVETVRRRVR